MDHLPAYDKGEKWPQGETATWWIIPFSKWLITMVSFRPLSRVVPLPNGFVKKGGSLTCRRTMPPRSPTPQNDKEENKSITFNIG